MDAHDTVANPSDDRASAGDEKDSPQEGDDAKAAWPQLSELELDVCLAATLSEPPAEHADGVRQDEAAADLSTAQIRK